MIDDLASKVSLVTFNIYVTKKPNKKVTLLQKKKKKVMFSSFILCRDVCVLERRTSFSKRNCMFCLLIHGAEIDEIMVRW